MKSHMKTLDKISYILIIILSYILCSIFYINSKADSSFWIKFIDVGQGDSALIQCDGHYMMIDGGPSDASSKIYTILKDSEILNIDYMVATHPDADHIGGLAGALNYSKIGICYSPVLVHDTKTFNSMVKYLNKQGKTLTVPKTGDTIKLGAAKINFLGPLLNSADTNNNSIVILIEYGNNKFLFMGDAEENEENQIINFNDNLKCDVIKIGHHGSKNSTSNKLLAKTSPNYAIISVGKDNSYGHPTSPVLNRLAANNIKIYRTDIQGDILLVSNGNDINITTQKNAIPSSTSNMSEIVIPVDTTYVLNTNTKKFHYVTCKSVTQMKSKNRAFSTADANELINSGYSPCGNCKPH